jgi:undecaprenyl diphosphate synthase
MNPIKHVAIIMDGNGRWGLENKGSRNLGHKAGLDTIEQIIQQSIEEKINYLTLYTFSTENWKRPKSEILFLFALLENFLLKKSKILTKNKIKLKILGDKKKLTTRLQKLLLKTENKTSEYSKLQINLALNYGAKDEIVNAVRNINKNKEKITKKKIDENLYTRGIPNPDLLIRTGNTQRLSNFLLWQLSYTEIFFEKKLWPDFKKIDYRRILKKYRNLKINFGAIS